MPKKGKIDLKTEIKPIVKTVTVLSDRKDLKDKHREQLSIKLPKRIVRALKLSKGDKIEFILNLPIKDFENALRIRIIK